MQDNKKILITGATGSLGSALAEYLLAERNGPIPQLVLFSRDETKQHQLAAYLAHRFGHITSEHIQFRLGDIRNYDSVVKALQGVDTVVHCAALKQVPNCERFPEEAIATNIVGVLNIINAIQNLALPVKTVIGISTDKAVEPVNAMGMTKALQEKILSAANHDYQSTRFISVRYGNVVGSRASVIPVFQAQIASGGPVTLTDPDMTRFLIPVNAAINSIAYAYQHASPGSIVVPRIRAARIGDIANVLIAQSGKAVKLVTIGSRPGEKKHETLVTADEMTRTVVSDDYFTIRPTVAVHGKPPAINAPLSAASFCSGDHLMSVTELSAYLSELDSTRAINSTTFRLTQVS